MRSTFGAPARTAEGPGPDHLLPFRSAILAVRAAAAIATIGLAAGDFAGGDLRVILICAATVGYSALRIIHPLRFRSRAAQIHGPLALETTSMVLAVLLTGFWDSPFVFMLSTAMVVVAFARGFKIAVRVALVIAVFITVPHLLLADHADIDMVRTSSQWTLWLLLLAFVSGHARRVTGEATRQHDLALDRLGRMADANRLLHSFHQLAQTLPASLDLEESLTNLTDQLRGLFEVDGLAVLLTDETDGTWTVVREEGGRLPPSLRVHELPEGLRRARAARFPITVPIGPDRPGLFSARRSGLYVALRARDEVICLLALESRSTHAYSDRDRELLAGFAEPAAFALDNARWFGRLRMIGADEERTRIARDLHDRIGQSLAYLAFELDRIIRIDERGDPVTPDLEVLRDEARGIVGEMREALYDLRTDIADSSDPVAALRNFMNRVATRSGMEVEVHAEVLHRLPPLPERELWRIAQEAIANAERHADAKRVSIRWRTDRDSAIVEVSDDGVGYAGESAGRVDSYGIRGMRERAASIGASLDIGPGPDGGTVVRCTLDPPSAVPG